MKALLAELGDPQLAYPAVHVVGTNGKSTATVTIEQLLLAEGLTVGATLSPHVRSWSERIRIDGLPADLPAALARIRPAAERVGATQFETITAAAFDAFAQARVDVAVVEAGLGGRHDATNVVRSRVVLLTNVGLEHTDVLGDTVEEIAIEKLAVVHDDDTIVVISDDTFRPLVPTGHVVLGGAHEAAEAFVGHRIDAAVDAELPGRLERRPGEVRDGAHNADGVAWLRAHLDRSDYTICASILRDKNVDEMLGLLASLGERFVATSSSNARSLPAACSPSTRGGTSPSWKRSRSRPPPCAARTSSASRFSSRARSISWPISRRQTGDETALPHARTHRGPHLRARRPRRHRGTCVRRRVYPRQAPSLRLPTMIIAESFFDSNTFTLARNLTVFFVIVFWLATAFWVFKDARRRIDDPWLVGMAALLGLVPPFIGPIVYLFLRPPDSIEERRDRELENRALEDRLAERDLHCPVCRGEVDASFLVCPVCTTRLKQACSSCGSPLEQIWQVCPYCATPVPPAAVTGDEVLQPLRVRRTS